MACLATFPDGSPFKCPVLFDKVEAIKPPRLDDSSQYLDCPYVDDDMGYRLDKEIESLGQWQLKLSYCQSLVNQQKSLLSTTVDMPYEFCNHQIPIPYLDPKIDEACVILDPEVYTYIQAFLLQETLEAECT